jgi:hypothetical protein
MKHLLTLLFYFISLVLSAQSEKSEKSIDTVDVTYIMYEQFSDIKLEQEIEELKIDFDSITKSEFENYKDNYRQKVDTISKTISRNENKFTLRASDTIFEFPSEIDRTFYYGGYYPYLKSHLIKVAGAGICEMFLIDEQTETGVLLPAFYDGSCNQPTISPDNRFLMTYGTCPEGKWCYDWYNQISTISIIDISKCTSITKLSKFKYIAINDFAIEDIFWIDNNYIALKVFDVKYGKNGRNYQKTIRYVKGQIKW